jgi:hypothetical protein
MPEEHYELVYTSVASRRFSQRDLTDLLAQSRKDNLEDGITGLLLYAEGHFMQLLEGSREKIERLMVRINRDLRHHDVRVLEEGPVSHRQFSEWSMAFLDFASPQVRALPGYSAFLESPLAIDDGVDAATRNMRLLHYFKAVMIASDSAVLNLAEAIDQQNADPPGEA